MTNVLLDRCRLRSRGKSGGAGRRASAAAVAGLVMLMGASAASVSQARPMPGSFADLAEKVTPAVVNISVERERSMAGFRMPERYREFYRRFFPNNPQLRPNRPGTPFQRRFRSRGVGSGFIIDPTGYVVTNHHVVRGATKVTVTMADGTNYTAKVIGTDPKTDLALLKIETKKALPYVSWANSDKARVGDWVMAVGNPFGLGSTVTAGIISARGRNIGGRTIVDYLQIDAPINRGNSGGPTFDLEGNVVGVNTAIYSPNGGSVGLGFAIPSNVAKRVVDQLKSRGKVDRGWLGVQIQPVSKEIAEALKLPDERGALVAAVVPGSPAAKAGFRSGDVIRSWGGQQVKNVRDLVRKVADTNSGSSVKAVVWRQGNQATLTVRVGDLAKANVNRTPAGGNTPPDRGGFAPSLGKVGLSVMELNPDVRRSRRIGPDVQGVIVTEVKPDTPASRANLVQGDIITKVGDTPILSAADLRKAIQAARQAGRKAVLVMIQRNGRPHFVGLGVG